MHDRQLQWVHGPITVVIARWQRPTSSRSHCASMGPRSDNRGYVEHAPDSAAPMAASMGPRSDNRGYATLATCRRLACSELQWVHGPITVVMSTRQSQMAVGDDGFNGSTVR